jgi:type I restriction enzyme S subunit
VRPDNNHFGFIAEHQDNLTGSNAFAVLSPIDDSCQEFLYLAATSPRSIERLASLANGAAYPSVRPETVFSTPCIVPCPKVMQAFHDVASPLMMKCWANQKMGYLLSDLRDTLLPRLISGKLRLNEIEKSLP